MHEERNRNVWKRQQNAALKIFGRLYVYTNTVYPLFFMFATRVCVCVLMGQKCKNSVDLANLDSTFDYGFIFCCFRWHSLGSRRHPLLADRLPDCLTFIFTSRPILYANR